MLVLPYKIKIQKKKYIAQLQKKLPEFKQFIRHLFKYPSNIVMIVFYLSLITVIVIAFFYGYSIFDFTLHLYGLIKFCFFVEKGISTGYNQGFYTRTALDYLTNYKKVFYINYEEGVLKPV